MRAFGYFDQPLAALATDSGAKSSPDFEIPPSSKQGLNSAHQMNYHAKTRA
jgi:hypothetical protein